MNLMKNYTDEELAYHINSEGLEHFFLEYCDPSTIYDAELQEAVETFRETHSLIVDILTQNGVDLDN